MDAYTVAQHVCIICVHWYDDPGRVTITDGMLDAMMLVFAVNRSSFNYVTFGTTNPVQNANNKEPCSNQAVPANGSKECPTI